MGMAIPGPRAATICNATVVPVAGQRRVSVEERHSAQVLELREVRPSGARLTLLAVRAMSSAPSAGLAIYERLYTD